VAVQTAASALPVQLPLLAPLPGQPLLVLARRHRGYQG
jgi:hypothetical protein